MLKYTLSSITGSDHVYPVVIFNDAASVYGMNVPDIQGVHSWGDSVEDALNNVRVAITSHIETLLELGEPVDITQSKIEALHRRGVRSAIWTRLNALGALEAFRYLSACVRNLSGDS